jgi:hypothetical protein
MTKGVAQDAVFWARVDAFVDRAPTDDDLRSHRLEVLAARRLRSLGRAIPEDFVMLEKLAAIGAMTAPVVLRRIRDAVEGPVVLFKGPEVAALYPDAARHFGDLDVLVPAPEAVHRALLNADFTLVGDPSLYVGIHHLRPVLASGTPLPVDVHSRPKWFGRSPPPRIDELLEAAGPAQVGVEGVVAPSPEHHVLLLAAHSWAHEPLRRLRDLIDIAAVASLTDRRDVVRIARSWGIAKLWATTEDAIDHLFAEGPPSWPMRTWARGLTTTTERTVLANHVARWLSDFSAMPVGAATSRLPGTLLAEVRPDADETWAQKLQRTALAVRNAARRRSQHERQVDALSASSSLSRDTHGARRARADALVSERDEAGPSTRA